MKFIRVRDAASQFGFPTTAALDRWIRRYNEKSPQQPIRRRRGAVVLADLEGAIEQEVRRHTPSAADEEQSHE